VIGCAAQDDGFCRTIADRLGAVVAAVDYRLAPEHTFPAALDDCYDALVWLARRSDIDETRVAVGGASAGGGLAAALALAARDRAEISLVLQVLAYPMLDDRTALRKDIDQHNFRLWNNKANAFGWQSYLGTTPGSADVSGLASPARHPDLSGLPPAWVGVGTLDLFRDEATVYADRLLAAGVHCDVDVVHGAFHAFDLMSPKSSITQQFRAAQVRALARAFRSDIVEGT
jgi:acetyl esterase/lipase